MHTHLHGVGARLEHGDEPRRTDAPSQSLEGGGDGGRVMCEIVIDVHASGHTRQFHAAAHAGETAQRREGLRHRHTGMVRGCDGRQCVIDVVPAQLLPLHLTLRLAVVQHRKAAEVAIGGHLRRPLRRGL